MSLAHVIEIAAPFAADDGITRVFDANRALWVLEDLVRGASSDPEIAQLKRQIDVANLARHARIDELDDVVASRLVGIGATGPAFNSESFGEMIDRASILALKLEVLADPARRSSVVARWDHLIATMRWWIAEATAGRLAIAPRREIKMYGETSHAAT